MNRDKAIEAGVKGLREFSPVLAASLVEREVVAAIIDAAAPHLEAAALREAASQAWELDRAEEPVSTAYLWLRNRAKRIERGEP